MAGFLPWIKPEIACVAVQQSFGEQAGKYFLLGTPEQRVVQLDKVDIGVKRCRNALENH